MIHQFIQHQAKRIDIHSAVVLFSPVHLRCHIGIGSLFGKGTHGFFQLSGDSKVSQLEIPESGYKNILGLDIPVNNVKLPAVFQ